MSFKIIATTRASLLAALVVVGAAARLTLADDAASTEKLPAAKAIFDKYVEATGGRAAYEKFKSRSVTGTIALPAQNINGTMTAHMTAPDKARIVQDLTGIGKIEQGHDGKTLWEMSPMSGVRLIEGVERDSMMEGLTFNSELQADKLYGAAETVGVKDIDGKPAYDVKLTSKVGNKVSHAYYDKASGLLVQRDAVIVSPAGEMNAVSKFTDYREFDGIKFPGVTTTTVAGTTFTVTTDKVEHDKPIPAGTFDLPEDVKKLVAKSPATKPAM